jgi:hypothetical protein
LFSDTQSDIRVQTEDSEGKMTGFPRGIGGGASDISISNKETRRESYVVGIGEEEMPRGEETRP